MGGAEKRRRVTMRRSRASCGSQASWSIVANRDPPCFRSPKPSVSQGKRCTATSPAPRTSCAPQHSMPPQIWSGKSPRGQVISPISPRLLSRGSRALWSCCEPTVDSLCCSVQPRTARLSRQSLPHRRFPWAGRSSINTTWIGQVGPSPTETNWSSTCYAHCCHSSSTPVPLLGKVQSSGDTYADGLAFRGALDHHPPTPDSPAETYRTSTRSASQRRGQLSSREQ